MVSYPRVPCISLVSSNPDEEGGFWSLYSPTSFDYRNSAHCVWISSDLQDQHLINSLFHLSCLSA